MLKLREGIEYACDPYDHRSFYVRSTAVLADRKLHAYVKLCGNEISYLSLRQWTRTEDGEDLLAKVETLWHVPIVDEWIGTVHAAFQIRSWESPWEEV